MPIGDETSKWTNTNNKYLWLRLQFIGLNTL